MTSSEALELNKGDVVLMEGDSADRGTVLFNNGEVVKIEWALYPGDPSLHRVDAMQMVSRAGRCLSEWSGAGTICRTHRCDIPEGHSGPHLCSCGRTRR